MPYLCHPELFISTISNCTLASSQQKDVHHEEGGGFFSAAQETSDLQYTTLKMELSGMGIKVLRHQDHMHGGELPHGFLLLQAAAKKVPALELGDITRGTIKAGWSRSRSERSSHGLDGVGAMSIREAAAARSAALPGRPSQAKGAALPFSAHSPPCLIAQSPKPACMLDISFGGCSSTADLHDNHGLHDLATAAPVTFINSTASLIATKYQHKEGFCMRQRMLAKQHRRLRRPLRRRWVETPAHSKRPGTKVRAFL